MQKVAALLLNRSSLFEFLDFKLFGKTSLSLVVNKQSSDGFWQKHPGDYNLFGKTSLVVNKKCSDGFWQKHPGD